MVKSWIHFPCPLTYLFIKGEKKKKRTGWVLSLFSKTKKKKKVLPYCLPSWRLKKGEVIISIGMIAWNELGVPHFKVFLKKANLFFIKAYNQFFEAFFWRKFKYSCKEPWNIGKITTQNVCIGFLYSSMQLTIGDIHNIIIEKSLLMILIKIT